MADFETTTDPNDCRVWHWGYVDIQDARYDSVKWGTTIKGYMSEMMKRNRTVHFHNLRFDGKFIIDWLLKNGYVHTESKVKTAPGEFTTLISAMNTQFYSITVVWKNGKTTEWRDSLKKFPGMSAAKIAESFKLPLTKGEIDYEKPRPVGYIPTPEEIDYLKRDIVIVAQALKMQQDEGMTKLTVASDSMADFKRGFGGEKRFRRYFPKLPLAIDAEIRQAYRGGWTYADDRFMGKRQGTGIVLDVNSLYPSVMAHCDLPYGMPKFFRGAPKPNGKHPLSIFNVTFTAKIKKRHVPCIQIKGTSLFAGTEYLKEIKEPTTLWVTSVDWELWNKHYDIEVVEYHTGWAFMSAQGLFDEYINKWMEVKANSTGGLREIAKLHLNSLYGKFATNPIVTGKYPCLEGNTVKYIQGEDETRDPVYTAMGAFITAYARRITITAAQENYGTFAYADTDSLHLLRTDTPSNIDVHPTKLGAWKFEYRFKSALYVRAKFYMERKSDGTYITRAAGVPESVSSLLTFDDLRNGNVIDRQWVRQRVWDRTGDIDAARRATGKLTPVGVPGGVVLVDTPWTIKI